MSQNKYAPKVWRPFSAFPSLFEEMDHMMSSSNGDGLSVSEHNGLVFVEASVPGLNPEDIDISIDKNVLWIKGKKSEEKEDKEKKYYHKATSSFSYCTSLPEGTDLNKEPKATCKNGVVTVTFSKKDKIEPKKIKVKAS
jgi:HSP20 family protein